MGEFKSRNIGNARGYRGEIDSFLFPNNHRGKRNIIYFIRYVFILCWYEIASTVNSTARQFTEIEIKIFVFVTEPLRACEARFISRIAI